MPDNNEIDEDEVLQFRLHDPRALPVGIEEFEEWSAMIIEDCGLPATPESIKWTLAAMILQLGHTEAFKPNSYFISALRKSAANQVAQQVMEDLKAKKQAEIKAEQEAKDKETVEVMKQVVTEHKDAAIDE